jgi:anti-anti-sigma factor
MAANLVFEEVKASNPEDTVIVKLSGDIDEFNQEVLSNLFGKYKEDDNVYNIVFNINNLDYVNSGVIGLFASFHVEMSELGKNFVFSEANDNIYGIFDLVGLTSVVDVFDTDEEACLSFED